MVNLNIGELNINPKNEIQQTFENSIENIHTIEALNATNKLSDVYIINNAYIVKYITRKHLLLHQVLTKYWNATLSDESLFVPFTSTKEMAKNEYTLLEQLYSNNIETAEPIVWETINENALIVLRYLDGETMDTVDVPTRYIDQVSNTVKQMHRNGIVHGDLQRDNIFIQNNTVHILDPTKMKQCHESKLYDIASIYSLIHMYYQDKAENYLTNYWSRNTITESKRYLRSIKLRSGFRTNIFSQ